MTLFIKEEEKEKYFNFDLFLGDAARENKEVIGHAQIFWGSEGFQITIFRIQENHRQKGYGSIFFRLVEANLITRFKLKTLKVSSSIDSSPFWRKCRFRIVNSNRQEHLIYMIKNY